MQIIPAIDLKDGHCVRLYQGDFEQEQIFSSDPVSIAMRWEKQGAERIHVVDLDGAFQGLPVNSEVIKEIVANVSVPVQLGGGIRNWRLAEGLIKGGIDRVVLGTTAVEGPALVQAMISQCGASSVVVSVDVRDGLVATRAWREQSRLAVDEVLESMLKIGVERFVYTDISRDGTLTEPIYLEVERIVRVVPALIVSGGISSLSQLSRLSVMGVEGVIVGKALYSGKFTLPSALDHLDELLSR